MSTQETINNLEAAYDLLYDAEGLKMDRSCGEQEDADQTILDAMEQAIVKLKCLKLIIRHA